jgi:hypothetical protein
LVLYNKQSKAKQSKANVPHHHQATIPKVPLSKQQPIKQQHTPPQQSSNLVEIKISIYNEK